MSTYCSYKDCSNVHRSFMSKTFFNLPNDARRAIWIKNSGNEKLQNIGPTVRRVFCEEHFDPKYLRRQFNRTLLRREAVPYPYIEAAEVQDEIVELIEMAESEEEPEQSQSEPLIESSDELVSLFHEKASNVQIQRTKPSSQVIFKQIQNESTQEKDTKFTKKLKYKSLQQDDEDDEIDVIVLEENSQESIEKDVNEGEQSISKKLRLEIEHIANRSKSNESSQAEKDEEIVIQNSAAAPIKSAAIVTRDITDGIVSSSETVDSNNEETYFALSLVGILKRLPPHKRAIAKCHILSYLTQLEYGSSSLS